MLYNKNNIFITFLNIFNKIKINFLFKIFVFILFIFTLKVYSNPTLPETKYDINSTLHLINTNIPNYLILGHGVFNYSLWKIYYGHLYITPFDCDEFDFAYLKWELKNIKNKNEYNKKLNELATLVYNQILKKKFAFSLKYYIPIKGDAFVARAIKEMRHQGIKEDSKLDLYSSKLKSILPNVSAGQDITVIYIPQNYKQADKQSKIEFYMKKKFLGSIDGNEFTKDFFDIWFSHKTSETKMRLNLLGLLD